MMHWIACMVVLSFLSPAEQTFERESCFPNPCQNGGTCSHPPGAPRDLCQCTFGFYGDRCEIPSNCTFKHIIEGINDTDHVDIIKFTGLNASEVDNCKNLCHTSAGCRAIDLKERTCNIFHEIPLNIPDMAPMRSEKGRLFAIRRCFRKKKSSQAKQQEKIKGHDPVPGESVHTGVLQENEDGEARQREEEKQGKEKEEMKKAEFIPQTRPEGRYKGEDTMPSRFEL